MTACTQPTLHTRIISVSMSSTWRCTSHSASQRFRNKIANTLDKNTQNSPYQGFRTRDAGHILRLYQLNIEGISKSKCEYLAKSIKELDVHVIALQENHIYDNNNLESRRKIEGYNIIASIHNKVYGIATYIRNDITDTHLLHQSNLNGTQTICIALAGLKIVNTYKPPNNKWEVESLRPYKHPTLYVGDYNSHHQEWG